MLRPPSQHEIAAVHQAYADAVSNRMRTENFKVYRDGTPEQKRDLRVSAQHWVHEHNPDVVASVNDITQRLAAGSRREPRITIAESMQRQREAANERYMALRPRPHHDY